MLPNLQPTHLQNELVKLVPLKVEDFERVYQAASDPLIWEQHPTKDRYKREVFQWFLESAIQSQSAFVILDSKTDKVIGSTRFYDYDNTKKEIAIGYTFLSKAYWGGGYNRAVKELMINYVFEFVDHVVLHKGAQNTRSQKATEKLGAIKIDEYEADFSGQEKVLHFVYQLDKEVWRTK